LGCVSHDGIAYVLGSIVSPVDGIRTSPIRIAGSSHSGARTPSGLRRLALRPLPAAGAQPLVAADEATPAAAALGCSFAKPASADGSSHSRRPTAGPPPRQMAKELAASVISQSPSCPWVPSLAVSAWPGFPRPR
jgi:hypothetical protein